MTDPAEFLEKMLADPETTATIQALHDKAQSYGEDKDQFLNYLLGKVTSWYTSKELMIVSMEGIKLMVLLGSPVVSNVKILTSVPSQTRIRVAFIFSS